MKDFMLWGVTAESRPYSLSFLVTRMQLQCINYGTRKMIDEMITDIGLPCIEYNDWSILHFFNNYYSSAEEKISSLDAWSDTWEISLKLAKPIPPDLVLPVDDKEIFRTYAHDDTWDTIAPSSTAPYIIVARFYSQYLFAKALTLFSEIREPHGKKDPDVQDLIDVIKKHPLSSYVSVKQRSVVPMELAVELGTFDETSFERGAKLIEQVSELIYELGATITWDEKSEYLIRKEQFPQPSE